MPPKNKSSIMAQTIIDGLKNGTAPWIKPWTPEQSVSPYNPVSGTRYRGVNFMHLAAFGKPDPRWMTFKQAQKNDWQVKKGSKGTVVQFWKFREKQDEKTDDHAKTETKRERPILRHYYVFNASDIDGIPELEKPDRNQEFKRHDRAENILTQSGAEIHHIRGDKAAYYPGDDRIVMPARDQFTNADGYYVTALHELGHWTGHPNRLNREIANPKGSEKYAREELRAEIASYMLGMQLGIGHDPGQHLAYVDSWIRDLEDHPTEIFKACADAEKIQTYMLAFEQKKEQTREDAMEHAPLKMRTMPESSELTGKRFISYFANQELDATGNINMELQQALQRSTTVGVLRFENALEKSLKEKSKINLTELSKAGIDGVVLTKNDKPVAAIATDKKQLFPGMYQATKGLKKNYLSIPFEDKDQAKKFGALWDKPAKSWFIPDGLDQRPFSKWQASRSVTADNPQQQFAEFIRDMGGDLQGHVPEMNGKIHRIPEIDGKRGNKDIAYVGYLDGVPAGYVKNFRGEERRWKMAGVVMTDDDRARLAKEGKEKKAQREKERQELYAQKAKESQAITRDLASATGKEKYFAEKGIKIKDPGVKVDPKGNIVVSLVDVDGKQWSHQTIQRSGFKQIFKDSRLQNTFALVGAGSVQDLKGGDILIAEGYSTAATIHEATGKPVVVSTTSNNLKHVAVALHQRYLDTSIYIMADDDRYLEPQGKMNAGLVKAKEAAKVVDGSVISPDFDDAKPDKTRTDFNDMARLHGKKAVRDHIQAKIDIARSGKKLQKEKKAEQERADAGVVR